jgi:hypothetical protein
MPAYWAWVVDINRDVEWMLIVLYASAESGQDAGCRGRRSHWLEV